MTGFEKIKVLIADDHKIVRDGLRSLLEKEADFEVVGVAKDGRSTLKMVEAMEPNVVVMDVSMPDLNGIESTHLIKKDFPKVKVIALSMHTAPRFVINMVKAGASGYLIKDCAYKELAAAIRQVTTKKQIYLSPGISEGVLQKCFSSTEDSPIFSALTSREREVLQLAVEGKNNLQIAEKLFVSVKTVECHRTAIFKKLKINSIAELTKLALREGITSLE